MSDGHDPLIDFGFADDTWIDRVRDAEAHVVYDCIGPFEILQEVPGGGRSLVFRARDRRSGNVVALKILPTGVTLAARTRRRFQREFDVVRRLAHPGIVQVFGLDHIAGQMVLSMEWIDGVPVTEWARLQSSPRAIVPLLMKIAEAVHHAHQRGVLHRDLKPANILVDGEGEPHVLDFGLAKVTETPDPRGTTLTVSGQFLGTPAYSSPEQVSGSPEDLDVRSDIYSLGVTFYHCLTGELPYPPGDSIARTFAAITQGEIRRPSRLDSAIGRELEAILMAMLGRSRAERYQSLDTLLADLRRWLAGEPVLVRGQTRGARLVTLVRRNPLPAALITGLFAVVTASAVVFAFLFHRAESEAERAREVQRFLESVLLPGEPGAAIGQLDLEDLLTRVRDRLAVDLSDHPETRAEIYLTMARLHAALWKWADTDADATRALGYFQEHAPASDPRVIRCLSLQGIARAFLHDPSSVPLLEEVRSRLAQASELPDPAVARCLGNLGFARWQALRDTAAARSAYEDALELWKAIPTSPDDGRAGTFYGAAAFFSSHGDPAHAAVLFREALEGFRSDPQRLDAYIRNCLHDAGANLVRLERWGEADSLLAEAIRETPRWFVDERLVAGSWLRGEIAL
ncbi:MAG: serine/threonine protein kinase, partial [Candidatus Eisenbacteria bacterium]|nr:serine/threonine protein kinase [Candidatus Eisenbacteria bacterium]